jgi:phosphate transport system substrate-binding protein
VLVRRTASRLGTLAACLVVATCASAPGGDRARPVRVVGSDTMLPLARAWAEAVMAAHPELEIAVTGGGSGAGVEALIRGTADIAASSRPMTGEELQRLYDRSGRLGVRFIVARDALSVYVHPSNPVRDLTLLQLKGIFTGRIGSWHKVGGREEPIEVLIRPPNSGTHRLFQELVLDLEPYAEDARVCATTGEIVAAVEAQPRAIGYGGQAYGAQVVHLRVEGAEPDEASVRDGSYPLARYLFLYTARPPTGAAKSFIDHALSAEGQREVEAAGYLPLWR